ncbi:MAG: IclR family transcriptional regulator [Chloroflexota bacterium]
MEKYAGTQAIARMFQLIQLFDDQNRYWSLQALVEASNLKQTTVFRLLSALEAEGVVSKTVGGDYTLGAELIRLGGRAMRANPFREVAQPYLRKLSRETSESTTLDILWLADDGANGKKRPLSMVIDEATGPHLLGMTQYTGVRFDAHTTSTGKVLLAWQPADVLANIDLDTLPSFTEKTIIDPEKFGRELKLVRKRSYAAAVDELEVGVCAVAAPIFNQHGEVLAAVSVGGPTSRINANRIESIGKLLVEETLKISRTLGF